MERKQIFEKINSLEKCKERAEQELKRHKDYEASLNGYISDLEAKIVNLRKMIVSNGFNSRGAKRGY